MSFDEFWHALRFDRRVIAADMHGKNHHC